jgi:hypothetical protein
VAIRLFEGCPVVCNDCFEELDVMLGLLENMPRQVAR